ncbi:MAG: hypothetical protein FJY17_04225 [Bacteroidetes bacterium]|nr:hypothetical protein [Bacteroidota bacterium]
MSDFFSKQTLIGLLIGLVSPFVFLPVVWFFLGQSQNYTFEYMKLQFELSDTIKSKHLSLALISNLIWFYYFLNKEKYLITRGLILGMLVYAPFMVYIYLSNYEIQ